MTTVARASVAETVACKGARKPRAQKNKHVQALVVAPLTDALHALYCREREHYEYYAGLMLEDRRRMLRADFDAGLPIPISEREIADELGGSCGVVPGCSEFLRQRHDEAVLAGQMPRPVAVVRKGRRAVVGEIRIAEGDTCPGCRKGIAAEQVGARLYCQGCAAYLRRAVDAIPTPPDDVAVVAVLGKTKVPMRRITRPGLPSLMVIAAQRTEARS